MSPLARSAGTEIVRRAVVRPVEEEARSAPVAVEHDGATTVAHTGRCEEPPSPRAVRCARCGSVISRHAVGPRIPR